MNILISLILFFTATFSLLSSTENNRIRSFDKLWRSVKEQYPYFERKNIDWNEIYKKYRPFVERAREDEEYILILRNMLAELEDGHADIIKPPLNLAGIGAFIEEKDNRIFVSQVLQDSPAETAGLKKGAEIIAVNDTLVSDYIYSLPTYFKKPRWRLRYLFFHGKINTSIVLTYKDPVEGIKRLEVKRLKKSYSHIETKIVFRKLEDEIGYIRIPVFTGENIVKDFDKALKELFSSKGLIIDIRSTPGGSSPISDMIVGRFIEDEIKIGSLLYKKPKYIQGIGLKNYFDCIVKPRGGKI
jgi:carboxyl-terminal processing protease